ncbi:hypothetical protein IGI04_031283 [Brassica rapa subsp. trilocularis]|uniref:SWIB domain-containing protein n=1 Tax=Brassica rapa subsp. trilocularis TaxID=1813537 RepID=A0ABQ7LTY2_BRACM|nr:hypothetical protein IGI04_031283 [Brassica rapa subsp. trilocularis]
MGRGPRIMIHIPSTSRVSPEMKDVVGESLETNVDSPKLGFALFSSLHLHEKDPQDKKVIICDEKLKKIFEGKDRDGFLEIAKLIGPHFL